MNGEVGSRYRAAKAPESLSSRGLSGGSVTRRRTGARRLLRLQADLSPRERGVLLSLAESRLLSTGQLQRLHFADHATEGAASRICRRVLARLHSLGVVEHLDRRIGGVRAGSASYVWRVGPVGERLLRQDADTPRGRHKQPGLRFVDHTLAVAECAVGLVEADRRGDLELLTLQHEPASWRPYLGPHGASEVLKPDLYAVTAGAEYEDSWFIELDRATESLPTLLRKCAQYARYRQTGREQAARGVFPAVLWVVPDDRRATAVAQAIRRQYGPDHDLFRVTTTACFVPTVTGQGCERTTTNGKEVT
ncbi:replication-relaxation family protein [Geodermatophilus sp. SYSU D01119]